MHARARIGKITIGKCFTEKRTSQITLNLLLAPRKEFFSAPRAAFAFRFAGELDVLPQRTEAAPWYD